MKIEVTRKYCTSDYMTVVKYHQINFIKISDPIRHSKIIIKIMRFHGDYYIIYDHITKLVHTLFSYKEAKLKLIELLLLHDIY